MSTPTASSRPPVAPAQTGPFPRRYGTAAAATLAVLLGALALDPVFAARGWLPPVTAAVLLVGLGGAVLRGAAGRLVGTDRLTRAVVGVAVPAAQALLVLCLLTAGFAADRSFAGFLPTWSSLDDLAAVLADGILEIQEQATPALPLTGLVALTTVFVALIALAVDLVAVAGRQAALGGLGLLVLYCVPVSTITGEVSLVSFLAPATGFGVLLWADQRNRLAGGSRAGSGSPLGTGTLAALRTGALALIAGVLLPALVPMLSEGSLATGLGDGTGDGVQRAARRAGASRADGPARGGHRSGGPGLPARGHAGRVQRGGLADERPRRRAVPRRRRAAGSTAGPDAGARGDRHHHRHGP
jgi:hypothetical protein